MSLVHLQGSWTPWLGRLTLSVILYHNGIVDGAFVFAAVTGIVILGVITYYRKWGYLIREWITSLDHKKIGVMYILIGLVMMFRGFIDALMIRTQQMMADGPDSPGHLQALHGYLPPYHFDQIYSSHGTIMILFAVTPILVGLMNLIVPLQIGARDMAFPYLNAVSLWLTAAGAGLVMASLFIGDFSHAGWIGLIPLTELPYSPGVGVDYWMWAIQIGSVGTTLGTVNLIATIVKMRAPGMTWFRMPIFTWTALSTNIIGLTAFPVLGVALALLGCDRYLGTHFYTAGLGGNLMLFTDLFWIWGHPEVYFLVLPAFGIISEIIPTFSERPLFGYITMVAATFAIAGISWSVWLHHFFTMGAGPDVNGFFSVATMLVGIPTGVKVFNWAFTLYRGRLRFDTPMLWAVGAVFLLLVGGLTGMMLAIPPINYTIHNSVFVVAHFHCMVLVVAFSIFGAIAYWFPKVFGFRLDEHNGKRVFACFSLGTFLVFAAMFALGFMGMTRRLDYLADPHWKPLLIVEEIGVFFYCVACYYFFRMLHVSIRDRAKNRVGADAWGTGRSPEWIARSPVPFYNFAATPHFNALDEAAWRRGQGLSDVAPRDYEPIATPKNTIAPPLIGALAFGFGFGMVWRIWWMAGLSLIAVIGVVILRSFATETEHVISAEQIRSMETTGSSVGIVTDHISPPVAEAEAFL
ncbi:cbb3-type cytochrome c oxidase subunit I [Acidiphilium sp. AL]|uniref:cbb3-type cytochrome c oxidase subunit I n=1 Tax=Acidiphilium sp. AL TaxID=2871704 RepID=UPI0021CAEB21|nr:cbb3-type cytochrome c oxidase subunit I [Acidiphilium sp. AL]MCU4161245.1 cbb3-type cytochrome c oxidase subunit I [Acidiphilium sp. AL]